MIFKSVRNVSFLTRFRRIDFIQNILFTKTEEFNRNKCHFNQFSGINIIHSQFLQLI